MPSIDWDLQTSLLPIVSVSLLGLLLLGNLILLLFQYLRRAQDRREFEHTFGALRTQLNGLERDLGARIESGLSTNSRVSLDRFAQIHERLATIDDAQRNITQLSEGMMSLQQILSDKQERGAFGQLRMETIVKDALPDSSYEFQATLSNGTRPDCLVHIPNSSPLVIDAKFPLENFQSYWDSTQREDRQAARTRVSRDLGKHIDDIARKYLIPGETQDVALLFIPSESIHVEVHSSFVELIQRAARARVLIVSPTTLMLAVQTIWAVLKDARVQEHADLIQKEVGELLLDVTRLEQQVKGLGEHFERVSRDVDSILQSTGKISKRAQRIESTDLEERGSSLS